MALATTRRDRLFIGVTLAALTGAALVFGLFVQFLWERSVEAEEARVELLAQNLGQRAEGLIVDALAQLEEFNSIEEPRCSAAHIDAMHRAALSRPHIRAIGYWRATERLCGVGFIQSTALKPARADRIYDSGVVAWWPGAQTDVGGLELFLLRFGEHDVAIDPGMLLEDTAEQDRKAALWVENLLMATTGDSADLPSPGEIPEGLTLDNANNRVLSRFSFGTVFPMDVVAMEPLQDFQDRYLPTLAAAGSFGLLLSVAWLYIVLRYSRHRMSMVSALRYAIQRGRITAYYQPIIELETGHCIGAEAVARWVRDDGEVVYPDVFVVLAEQEGMMNELTMAVLKSLTRDIGPLLREYPLARVNLNLAPEDFSNPDFMRRLREELANASIPAQCIKLEITESAMVDTDHSREQISELRRRGHEIAIDDFGTGYSSLSYLQSFELDTLKIDKSFVDAIGTEAVTNHVIVHVIDMAASLELDTVAEGIESSAQVEWLKQQGVAYGQGFYYSKPIAAEPFQSFYRAHRPPEAGDAGDAA